MPRILVTDGEQRSSLAVVRSLGRAGHEVVVCSSDPHAQAGFSRYCSASRVVPAAISDPAGFAAALERIVEADRVDMVIPMTDLSVPFGYGLRERLPEVIVPFPSQRTYETASHKQRVLEIARSIGVPVPRQHVVPCPGEGVEAALAGAAELGYPVIVKPSRSVVSNPTGAQFFAAKLAHRAEDLERALGALDPDAFPLLIQERIVGDGLGAFFLAKDGRVIARFGHRRIRERPPMGGSTHRVSVWRDDVQEYGERLVRGLQWTGVVMVEFKEDRATGIPHLMEVNGRFWGSLQLAIDAGVDFPALLVRSALGETLSPRSSFREGVRTRWLLGDVEHLLWALRAPEAYRQVHGRTPNTLRVLARLMVPWLPGERLEILEPTDPMPFFRESRRWVRDLAGRAIARARRALPEHRGRSARFERTSPETPMVISHEGP